MRNKNLLYAAIAIAVVGVLSVLLIQGELNTPSAVVEEPQEIPQMSMDQGHQHGLKESLLHFASNMAHMSELISQSDLENKSTVVSDEMLASSQGDSTLSGYFTSRKAISEGDTDTYRAGIIAISQGVGDDHEQEMRIALIEDLYLNAIEKEFDESWSRINLSNIYLSSGPPMRAIQQLLAVERKDTNNIEAIYRLATLSVRSGQLKKARERFKKLVSLQPENARFRDELIRVCEEIGDNECVEEYSAQN